MFSNAREHRHQVVELEDESDVRRAPGREIALGQTRDVDAADLDRPARRLVDAGDQIESVDLPEPEGPISATKSPSPTSRLMSTSTGMICSPRW